MTTDREYAEVLRNHQGADDFVWLAAIKRAIELLEGAADLEYVCPDIYPKDLDG